jgi:hypothetical protein
MQGIIGGVRRSAIDRCWLPRLFSKLTQRAKPDLRPRSRMGGAFGVGTIWTVASIRWGIDATDIETVS